MSDTSPTAAIVLFYLILSHNVGLEDVKFSLVMRNTGFPVPDRENDMLTK